MVFSSAIMYFGFARTATGLCDALLTVEVESRWDRVEGTGRGDFLGMDGDRLVIRLRPSDGLDCCSLAASTFVDLSDDLGPGQANLIIHFRGAGAATVGGAAAFSTRGASS